MSTDLGYRQVSRSAYAHESAQTLDIYLGTCEMHDRPVRYEGGNATPVSGQAGKYRIWCPVPEAGASGHWITAERLVAVKTTVTCDGSCMSARRPSCDCGCGGANHGRSWGVTANKGDVMSNYIFRMPEGTPDLTFDSLQRLLGDQLVAKIGSTVEVTHESSQRLVDGKPAIAVRLYGLLIARIGRDAVYFPATGDAHVATSYWLAKIVSDNGLGHNVWRIRRHKADGQGSPVPRGYAGLLAIDGDRGKPVEGHGYPKGCPVITHREA